MLMDVSLTINPINHIKLSKYLDSINWRISHVTKRPVKKELAIPQKQINILTGNLRSTEFPLLLQYSDSLLLEFPCHLLSDSVQISIKLSDHFQSALRDWVSEAIWSLTLVEAPLWPEVSKSLQNVTWPTCSVALDMDDIQCHVGGVPRRSMSNEAGFFSINDIAQSVDWSIPQVFPHLPLLLHIHLHLRFDQAAGTLVPALEATTVHGVEGEPALSQEVDLIPGDLDHVTDETNLPLLHVVCSINLAMNMTP